MRIVSSLDAQLALLLIGRSKDAGDGECQEKGKADVISTTESENRLSRLSNMSQREKDEFFTQ